MASSSLAQTSFLPFHGFRTSDSSSSYYSLLSCSAFRETCATRFNRTGLKHKCKNGAQICRAMVQETVQGPSAAYAREMERLSAKESLLLAVSILFLFFALFFILNLLDYHIFVKF